MNFRRKKAKGHVARISKLWLSENKQYRITWRSEVYGIALPPRFFACVRCVRRLDVLEDWWEFAGARRPYKTMKKAVEACERHEKAWTEIIALNPERHFITKLLAIREKYLYETRSIPKFAVRAVRQAILEQFSDNPRCKNDQDDDTGVSRTSDLSTSTMEATGGPVSSAVDVETSTAGLLTMTSTEGDESSCVLPAVAPATPPKQPSKTPTKRKPTTTRKKCGSGKSAKRPSKSSPKKRSRS